MIIVISSSIFSLFMNVQWNFNELYWKQSVESHNQHNIQINYILLCNVNKVRRNENLSLN